MDKWDRLADKAVVESTISALKGNGIDAYYVESGAEAKNKLFELLPQGASVMNNSSTTLNTIGVSDEIVKSGKYDSVRNQLMKMDSKTQGRQMQQMGSAPEWAVGSVHAVTQAGVIMIASASGSQLPGYVFGSDHIIWVVGTQKIVKDLDEAYKRIYEHCLPLENIRAQKVYGAPSSVNKILIINKEPIKSRISLIFVNEVLGF